MTNVCDYGEEQIAALLYEDDDDPEVLELRAHLATCASCRAELEDLSGMKDLLSAWPNAVNTPRMVYVSERPRLLARLRHWARDLGGFGTNVFLQPALGAAAVILMLVASAALLDVRVAPDGRLQIGLAGSGEGGDVVADVANAGADTAIDPSAEPVITPVSREELQADLEQAVSYMEDLFRSRSDEERRLLLATIDEGMRDQGMAMSQQLRGTIDAALADMQQQHENDLGLVFSAIDELSVITGMELQRMNTILASLMQGEPGTKE